MPARIKALITPTVLAWARKSAGHSIDSAAKELDLRPATLAGWESGSEDLTVGQLKKLAALYKRPLAVFYLPEPPRDFTPMKDYRRVRGAASGYSPRMALEIRRASQRREVALELAEAAGTVPRVFPVRANLSDDPAEVGHRLREALGIPLTTQEAWKDEYEALRVWREAMEALGVLVFRGQLDVDEARGFSLGEDLFPTVVVSSKDAPVARIFTLMHELAHVALRSGGVCDLEETTKLNRPEERVEVFCNAVAGEVLVPGHSLLRKIEVQSHGPSGTWDDGVLVDLGRRFHVSREVILRRLVTLGKASMGVYRSRRALWQSRLPVKAGSGFEAQDDKVIRECGQLYTRIVLSSYHEKAISLGDASDFLNVKTRFIPAVEQALHMSRSSFA